MPGTASRFIPLKQPGAYPITTGIRQLAQALTEPSSEESAANSIRQAFRLARRRKAALRQQETSAPSVADGFYFDEPGLTEVPVKEVVRAYLDERRT
jgi:hypothetical protein